MSKESSYSASTIGDEEDLPFELGYGYVKIWNARGSLPSEAGEELTMNIPTLEAFETETRTMTQLQQATIVKKFMRCPQISAEERLRVQDQVEKDINDHFERQQISLSDRQIAEMVSVAEKRWYPD